MVKVKFNVFSKFLLKPDREPNAKLPKLPNRYTIQFISDNCKKLSLLENFTLDSTTEGYLFNIMKNVSVTKSARIDQISEK